MRTAMLALRRLAVFFFLNQNLLDVGNPLD
jgi:hypothetical protein